MRNSTKWVFSITPGSFKNHEIGPLQEELQSTFPDDFIPSKVTEWVHLQFENEDGSLWGGLDPDLKVVFTEFFRYSERRHRPTFMTFRAWDKLRYQVNRLNWGPEEDSDLTPSVQERRKQFYKEGMYQKYGFPARVVVTLK